MLRHADSISEQNNLSTNLPHAGRLAIHRGSGEGGLEDRGAQTPTVAWNNHAVCHRCAHVARNTCVLARLTLARVWRERGSDSPAGGGEICEVRLLL